MPVNKDRLWFVTEQLVGAERWKGKVATLAGCIIPDPNDIRRYREVFESDTRDVLVFAPQELLLVKPKASGKMGLFSALRASRGRTDQLGEVQTVPRSEIASFEVSAVGPPGLRISGDVRFATLRYRGAGESRMLVFVVDPKTIAPGAVVENVTAWLKG